MGDGGSNCCPSSVCPFSAYRPVSEAVFSPLHFFACTQIQKANHSKPGRNIMRDFQTYTLAVRFHKNVSRLKFPGYLRNQLVRASSSVALNLSEGSARQSQKDQLRFYHIAFGSLRECQAALDLSPRSYPEAMALADRLGACLYRLCQSLNA